VAVRSSLSYPSVDGLPYGLWEVTGYESQFLSLDTGGCRKLQVVGNYGLAEVWVKRGTFDCMRIVVSKTYVPCRSSRSVLRARRSPLTVIEREKTHVVIILSLWCVRTNQAG
jgi:hypothetical protein